MVRLQPFVLLSLLCVVTASLGCDSGGLSQNDLKRMALRRGSDDDEDDDDEDSSGGESQNETERDETVDKQPGNETDSGKRDSKPTPRPARVDTTNDQRGGIRLLNASAANLPAIGQVAATPEETPELAIGVAPLEADATTAERLERLGAALDSYAQRHNRFPLQAIKRNGQPLLSWRVELLPYLGYVDLYTQFHFDEPWDSPRNEALLTQVPIEFLSGNGTDTQVLAMQCGSPLIASTRPTSIKRILDGTMNTIAAVHVDSAHAVPWTKPEDMRLPNSASTFCEASAPSFWAVFGDGTVYEIGKDLERTKLKALFSYDDESGLTPAQVVYSADNVNESASDVAKGGSRTDEDRAAIDRDSAPRAPTEDRGYRGTPTAAQLAKANDSLRTIYQDRYKRAKERGEKVALANEMLNGARDLDSDPAAQFALLRLSANVAAENADLSLVQKAVEMRVEQFPEWEGLTEFGELLQTVYKSGKKTDRKLADLAVELAERAMDEGSFNDADAMGDLAASVHKSARTEKLPDTYMRMKRRLNEFRGWRGRVNSAMETLANDENDGNANLIVGRFYCFFRGRWEDGLPLLANGNDLALKRLAELELYDSAALEQEVRLADEWWTTGEKVSTYRRDYHLRAYHWYTTAIDSGAGGVDKLRAEVRMKDVENRYLRHEQ